MLWVDHHDRAYRWARRKRCRVNPMTGVVQVCDAQLTMDEPEGHGSREETVKSPFAGVTDRQLLRMGVPEEKLAETRAITTIEELYAGKTAIPRMLMRTWRWLRPGSPWMRSWSTCARQAQRMRSFNWVALLALSNLPATRIMPAQRARSARSARRSAWRRCVNDPPAGRRSTKATRPWVGLSSQGGGSVALG